MTWLSTEKNTLTPEWDKQLPADVFREDRTDGEWINLDTGASIVLVADGGWRGAQRGDYNSRYRVFHRAGQAAPVELTYAFLGKALNGGVFEKGVTGSSTYVDVRNSCAAEIERILGEKLTKTHYQN